MLRLAATMWLGSKTISRAARYLDTCSNSDNPIIRRVTALARNFIDKTLTCSTAGGLFLSLFQRSPYPLGGEREILDADAETGVWDQD